MPFKKAVFIDQTAFLAFLGHNDYAKFYDTIDNWLSSFFKGMFSLTYDSLVTSDYVVLSVIEKLFENKQNENIILFVKNLIRSSSIKIINVPEEGFTHACRNIETYYSIFKFHFSFTDISTLYLLKSTRIKALLTCNSLFHRLEYLIRLDFNPEMDTNENRLYYDAIPDTLFSSEKEEPFQIYNEKVKPEDAIALFEIELSQWSILKVEVDDEFFVTTLKLGYEFENNPEDRKHELRSIPGCIFKLNKLTSLDLSKINLTLDENSLFNLLNNMSNLLYLDLSINNLNEIPSSLENLQKRNCRIII